MNNTGVYKFQKNACGAYKNHSSYANATYKQSYLMLYHHFHYVTLENGTIIQVLCS